MRFVYNFVCRYFVHVGSRLAAYAADDETGSDTFRQSSCGVRLARSAEDECRKHPRIVRLVHPVHVAGSGRRWNQPASADAGPTRC